METSQPKAHTSIEEPRFDFYVRIRPESPRARMIKQEASPSQLPERTSKPATTHDRPFPDTAVVLPSSGISSKPRGDSASMPASDNADE